MTTKTRPSKTLKIYSCMECPNLVKDYAGQGTHHLYCKKVEESGHYKGIARYADGPMDYPKTFPRWCPL